MTNTSPCLLCGNTRVDEVRPSLARWKDPEGALFSAIPRCHDRAACRARCEAMGEDWPVVDPGDPTVLPATIR